MKAELVTKNLNNPIHKMEITTNINKTYERPNKLTTPHPNPTPTPYNGHIQITTSPMFIYKSFIDYTYDRVIGVCGDTVLETSEKHPVLPSNQAKIAIQYRLTKV